MIFWMYKIVKVEIIFAEDEFLIAYTVLIAYLTSHASRATDT